MIAHLASNIHVQSDVNPVHSGPRMDWFCCNLFAGFEQMGNTNDKKRKNERKWFSSPQRGFVFDFRLAGNALHRCSAGRRGCWVKEQLQIVRFRSPSGSKTPETLGWNSTPLHPDHRHWVGPKRRPHRKSTRMSSLLVVLI